MGRREKPDSNSLYCRFGMMLLIGILVGSVCFLLLQTAGKLAINTYFEQSGFAEKENNRRLQSLEAYISKEDIALTDSEKITEWVLRQSVVSLQIYVDDNLIYDSDYDQDERPAFSISGDYQDYDEYHKIKFTDQIGYVFLSGNYAYQFEMYAMIAELILSLLVMIGIVMAEVRRTIRYVCCLNQEILILESGDLSYEITIQGEDELASMARGLNQMRLSLQEQMREKDEALLMNQKLVTGLSHELRTPLTAMMIYLEIMRTESETEGVRQELMDDYLAKLEQKAQEIKELTDHIREYEHWSSWTPI